GSTAADTSGNGNAGTIVGTVQTGAVGGPTGDGSGAYQFAGGAVNLALPQVNASAGGANTVAFWMNWDGTDGVMPFGFTSYDLFLANGSFGFNTGNSDLYGTSSAGLANRWVYVTAAFANGDI